MMKMKFKDYPLDQSILKAIELLNYESPTPVQEQVIPALLEDVDVIVQSETGSGKTAAFGIPILNQVEWDNNEPQVLVLTPTRELAQQVKEELFNIGRFKRMKVSAVYGKTPIRSQIKELKQKTHVVVGTPGRVKDHIERGSLDLSNIKYLVLDEADEMLNMGFIDQIESILVDLPKDIVTTLLSATMPEDIHSLCDAYMQSPIVVEIETRKTRDNIEQIGYNVNKKKDLLLDITMLENPDSCIIFCNTRLEVDFIHTLLTKWSYPCRKLHGGMEQDDRTKVMQHFRQGKFRYLVATDVAARGIHIDGISLVINYDLPEEAEVYIHRMGRTGRQDNTGKVINFVSDDQAYLLKGIERLTETPMVFNDLPDPDLVLQSRKAFEEKLMVRPTKKQDKTAALNTEILKLHINAGKKTKMRAGDIVGTLCNIEGVTAEDIGNISITDVSTFVEILNNKGEHVFLTLQDKPIKGRLRKVSKANA